MSNSELVLLRDVILELLACCELNLDELEQETQETIAKAREVLGQVPHPPSGAEATD